ncbi:MAG: hypothetical protein AAFY15_05610 [Cyanobacteria bacterium J06648_11]
MTVQSSAQSEVAQQAMQRFADRMQDPMQAIEDVRLEDEANCTIGAGYGGGATADSSMGGSQMTQRQRQQLRILVSGEFCQMLNDCNLGAGLPDAIRVGKQILAERLKQPSESVQQLMAAVDTAMTPDEEHGGVPDRVRSQVRGVLCSLLSDQDWEAISAAATTAIQRHFRQKIAGVEAA